jgi:hypothetical protein
MIHDSKLISKKNISMTDAITIQGDQPDADFIAETMSTPRFVMLYTGLIMAVFIVTLDYSILPQAIPQIAKEFGMDKISFIGVGYLFTATATAPLYGSFCDIFGRKITYMIAI